MECQYEQKKGKKIKCNKKATKNSEFCPNHKRRVEKPEIFEEKIEIDKKFDEISLIETILGENAEDDEELTEYEKSLALYIECVIDNKLANYKFPEKSKFESIMTILISSITPIIINKLLSSDIFKNIFDSNIVDDINNKSIDNESKTQENVGSAIIKNAGHTESENDTKKEQVSNA